MNAENVRALAEAIESCEDFADHLASLSAIARERGDGNLADAFAGHGRLHRVKAIQMQAQIGALAEAYGLSRRTPR